jgi:transposase-like protein
MKKAKNDRWTESYAREVLDRAKKRNLSDSAVARELGVSPQRVYWWRKRLEAAEAPAPSFVEVKLPAPRPFALTTQSGCIIEVWPGFDAAELARLITAVEGAC